MADVSIASRYAGLKEKLVDLGDGHHALVVVIGGLDGDVEITGDANIDNTGVEAALASILAELEAQTALLTTIAANTA